MSTRSHTTLALAVALTTALTLSACGGTDVLASPQTDSADATPRPAPTVVTSTPEPIPAIVGVVVPAADIDAVRATGAKVFVSPNGDGTGLVVDPAMPLPDAVVADIEAATSGGPSATMSAFDDQSGAVRRLNAAMIDAEVAAFFLTWAPSFGADGTLADQQYVVRVYNVPGAREYVAAAGDTRTETKAGAIAAAQALIDATPGAVIIDTTD